MSAISNGFEMISAISSPAPTPEKTVNKNTVTPNNRHGDLAFETPSSLSGPSNYRLLYRGALSLPDSYLLLDGLTFSARLESPMKHQLLENPLALALESMRGRQSLRFLTTVKLSDIWLDESGNVEMQIHPRATLSKIYFENIFCLLPYPSTSTSTSHHPIDQPPGIKSELGVKIALGDADGPDTTQIVVFGQVVASHARTIKLRVARLTPHPLPRPISNRIPRPDDPIPRRPPVMFNRNNSIGINSFPRDLKRTASASSSASAFSLVYGDGGAVTKKQKLTNGAAKDLPKPSSQSTTGDRIFKVPSLPGKAKGKGKGKEDVFGSVLKRKTSFGDDLRKEKDVGETEIERANKNLIKKAALEHLCRTKDPTLRRNVDRTHPEFKEIWGWIYRGVGFALRAHMKSTPLDRRHIHTLIETHARMYVGEPLDRTRSTG